MTGRYYVTPNGDPYYNMALDEWLFAAIQKRTDFAPAVLRLYSWDRGAITIGYNQNPSKAVDFDALDTDVPMIRRITGGRAIYHDPSEITFSLALNQAIFPETSRSLSRTNTFISGSVVEALESAGIDVSWSRQSEPGFAAGREIPRKSCFGSISKYEIISRLGKIAGGAQRMIGSSLIHQCSIKINGVSDCPAIGQNQAPASGEESLNKNTGKKLGLSDFTEAFRLVFSRNLGVRLDLTEFSAGDTKEIELFIQRVAEKRLEKR